MNVFVSSSIKNKSSLGLTQIFKSRVWLSWEMQDLHLVFTLPVSVILGLGTGVVTISCPFQRKNSKAVSSGDIFEQFAVLQAQDPHILKINMLSILHSIISFHINLSFKVPVSRVLPFPCLALADKEAWTQERTFHIPRVASEVSLCIELESTR